MARTKSTTNPAEVELIGKLRKLSRVSHIPVAEICRLLTLLVSVAVDVKRARELWASDVAPRLAKNPEFLAMARSNAVLLYPFFGEALEAKKPPARGTPQH